MLASQWAASSVYSARTVAGVMAVLLVDLWRVDAAIELAGRGPLSEELLDAVA